MARILRRCWSGSVTGGLGVLAMIAAHCSAHLAAGVLGLGAPPHGYHAHLGHAGAEHGTGELVHLLPAASATSAALLVTLMAAVLGVRRCRRFAVPSVQHLLVVQFVALAVLEGLQVQLSSVSWSEALQDQRILLAAVAQVPVALLIHRWARHTLVIAHQLLAATRRVVRAGPSLRAAPVMARVPRAVRLPVDAAPRGPPGEGLVTT